MRYVQSFLAAMLASALIALFVASLIWIGDATGLGGWGVFGALLFFGAVWRIVHDVLND